MNTENVKKLPPLDRFLYWIKERHSVYQLRQRGKPWPWTDDEILQQYYFTNPYRENDKTTVWFRRYVRNPLMNDPAVLMATVIFRWFNYISTGKVLMEYDLLTRWRSKTAKVKLRHLPKVFTGAFNISNSGSTKPKIDRVCDDYIQPMWESRKVLIDYLHDCTTMEAAHTMLKQYVGMGGSGFMAYEVVCDLRYTMFLCHATDKFVWSNSGPGAKRGLNRLMGEPVNQPISKKKWLANTKHLLGEARKLRLKPRLEMREIEHSLCEFWKYEKALFGLGHLKRRYHSNGHLKRRYYGTQAQ